jgi:hypothetical protein
LFLTQAEGVSTDECESNQAINSAHGQTLL